MAQNLHVEKLEKEFNLDWLRRKKNKTKAEIKRLKIFDEKKAKIPPFDEKCKQCGRPIPAPLEFCSSHCKGEYYGWKIREEKSKRTQKTLKEVTEDHK